MYRKQSIEFFFLFWLHTAHLDVVLAFQIHIVKNQHVISHTIEGANVYEYMLCLMMLKRSKKKKINKQKQILEMCMRAVTINPHKYSFYVHATFICIYEHGNEKENIIDSIYYYTNIEQNQYHYPNMLN